MRIFVQLKLRLNGNLEDYEVGIDLKEKGEDSGRSGFSPFLFLYGMIKGEYPALENKATGEVKLYATKEDIAKELGVTTRTIYRYIEEKKSPPGYTLVKEMLRVFLIRTKDGRFRICKRMNDTWVVAGSDKDVIRDEDMEKWMDISDIFYNGKRHERV